MNYRDIYEKRLAQRGMPAPAAKCSEPPYLDAPRVGKKYEVNWPKLNGQGEAICVDFLTRGRIRADGADVVEIDPREMPGGRQAKEAGIELVDPDGRTRELRAADEGDGLTDKLIDFLTGA